MGLSTDTIFISALQSSSELMALLGQTDERPARLYGTAIPLPDEELENVPTPYIVVTFDSLTNETGTKDDRYEGSEDRVEIGVLVCAKTLKELHRLTDMVRRTVLNYLLNTPTSVEDYVLSADSIQLDSFSPAYWQTLHYQCEVENTYDDEDED